MARKISEKFIKEFTENSLKPVLEYVKSDDTLAMELRGKEVMIYYRGGMILAIKEESYEFTGLSVGYGEIEKPSLTTFENYFPKAKHLIDFYTKNTWEKDIQQRIVQENNYSPNSKGTDYFIIDTEYECNTGRFDFVALRWDSTTPARRLQKGYKTGITIFEVKQGVDSLTGDSGIKGHYHKFEDFIANRPNVDNFISDMVDVFQQKRCLGLVIDIDILKSLTKADVMPDIEFVFLLTNYNSDSKKLSNELENIGDCEFICANPMGYGLYERNIISKHEFLKRFSTP